MAKFDMSMYNALWSESGRNVMTALLTDPRFYKANFTFWQQKFTVDTEITPTDQHGTAQFMAKERKIEPANMFSMRAPLGDSTPRTKGNLAYYQGVIPNFIAEGFVEQAQEREEKKRLFEQFGDDALLAAYASDYLQTVRDGMNMTLSNMAAQMISTAQIDYTLGLGIQEKVLKAEVPTQNFHTAGKVVWSDVRNCKLLDQLRKFVEDATIQHGMEIDWQLEVTQKMFDEYISQNNQVLEQVRFFNSKYGVMMPEVAQITDEMVMDMWSKYKGIPKLVIVNEIQNDAEKGVVHGWKENTAVMRPIGFAGVVKHTSNLDSYLYKNYGSKSIDRVFSMTADGLLTIMNSTLDNGNLKEWHSDAMFQAVPVLDRFNYHHIINTVEADA